MELYLIDENLIDRHLTNALYGLGLSYNLVNSYHEFGICRSNGLWNKLFKIATNLSDKNFNKKRFLRMIPVTMVIRASLFWWKKFDMYKTGIVQQSESFAHIATKKEFIKDDFETGGTSWDYCLYLKNHTIPDLNIFLKNFNDSNWIKNLVFRDITSLLPSSFLQRKIVTMNYEVIKLMYNRRKNHIDCEWKLLFNYLRDKLPYFDEFIINKEKK